MYERVPVIGALVLGFLGGIVAACLVGFWLLRSDFTGVNWDGE